MNRLSPPTKCDSIIDSRDVIEAVKCFDDSHPDYAEFVALADQGETLDDWAYGVTLIRDDYFEDYAREFAEEIGAVRGDESWPQCCIDWAQAARELQQDYTPLDFGGITYWAR